MEYELLPWDPVPIFSDVVDSVSMAVVLEFDNGVRYRVHWVVWKEIECLDASDADDPERNPFTRTEDVSSRWVDLIGSRLLAQRVAVQETNWGVQPWACRFDFDQERRLVIALGEIVDGKPISYIPDNIVVTGSSECAQAYRPPTAFSSAWVES